MNYLQLNYVDKKPLASNYFMKVTVNMRLSGNNPCVLEYFQLALLMLHVLISGSIQAWCLLLAGFVSQCGCFQSCIVKTAMEGRAPLI